MDDATIAGNLNQTLSEASGSVHFREHLNELGDTLVIEYHFTALPQKIDFTHLTAAFDTVHALYWTAHSGRNAFNIDGVVGQRKVSVELILQKESS